LTPNQSGTLFFFDKHRKEFLSLQSRGPVDSSTAYQVYTQHQYNFGFLVRSQDIQSKYESILLSGKEALIVDCGANIGLSARYFATEYPLCTYDAPRFPDRGEAHKVSEAK